LAATLPIKLTNSRAKPTPSNAVDARIAAVPDPPDGHATTTKKLII
jgi:hypothetical protein